MGPQKNGIERTYPPELTEVDKKELEFLRTKDGRSAVRMATEDLMSLSPEEIDLIASGNAIPDPDVRNRFAWNLRNNPNGASTKNIMQALEANLFDDGIVE